MIGKKKIEIIKKLETGKYVLVVADVDSNYTLVYYFNSRYNLISFKRTCKLKRMSWRFIHSKEIYHITETINFLLNFDYDEFRTIKIGDYLQRTWLRRNGSKGT